MHICAEQIDDCQALLDEAHRRKKPVMIGESTPRRIGVLRGKKSWDEWYAPYFRRIRKSPGIKAFCYINCDWSIHEQWKDWGDARIQQNDTVLENYRKEMESPLYFHGTSREAFFRLFRKE